MAGEGAGGESAGEEEEEAGEEEEKEGSTGSQVSVVCVAEEEEVLLRSPLSMEAVLVSMHLHVLGKCADGLIAPLLLGRDLQQDQHEGAASSGGGSQTAAGQPTHPSPPLHNKVSKRHAGHCSRLAGRSMTVGGMLVPRQRQRPGAGKEQGDQEEGGGRVIKRHCRGEDRQQATMVRQPAT